MFLTSTLQVWKIWALCLMAVADLPHWISRISTLQVWQICLLCFMAVAEWVPWISTIFIYTTWLIVIICATALPPPQVPAPSPAPRQLEPYWRAALVSPPAGWLSLGLPTKVLRIVFSFPCKGRLRFVGRPFACSVWSSGVGYLIGLSLFHFFFVSLQIK